MHVKLLSLSLSLCFAHTWSIFKLTLRLEEKNKIWTLVKSFNFPKICGIYRTSWLLRLGWVKEIRSAVANTTAALLPPTDGLLPPSSSSRLRPAQREALCYLIFLPSGLLPSFIFLVISFPPYISSPHIIAKNSPGLERMTTGPWAERTAKTFRAKLLRMLPVNASVCNGLPLIGQMLKNKVPYSH